MQRLCGKPVYKGIAAGPVAVLKKNRILVKRIKTEDVKGELARLAAARDQVKEQLQILRQKAMKEAGTSGGAIFEAHQMMLDDEEYLDFICSRIETEMVNAEYAVNEAGDRFSEMFASMDDEYMKARAADIRDVSHRLVCTLAGAEDTDFVRMEPAVIVADDLSPEEMLQMEEGKILAFVTAHGSANSHTAILARMMKIPALVGVPVDFNQIHEGMKAVVDSFKGEVIFEPSDEICEEIEKRVRQETEQDELLRDLKGKENITRDGRKISICANIGSIRELEDVLEHDADGIGLFRSEFLYLGRRDFPSEEEQFQIYRQAAETMAGKKVIIRTLDVGGDKCADYFKLEKEKNPAMGYRGIRICLKQPELFKTQLRALFRAAFFGNLWVMYPMIISAEEVHKIRKIVEEVRQELEREQIPHKIPKQGVMIETPAAVMISDELAELADFFSIGTNDLTQYTLAIDRQNEKLNEFYHPHHKAVMKMIKMTVDNAHKCGKQVGICGELGADLKLTEEFVKMGVDELSVVPSEILKLRKVVRAL